MAMWRCKCGEWVSSTKKHKCTKEPFELKVFNTKEPKTNPFFKGYKSTKFFNT